MSLARTLTLATLASLPVPLAALAEQEPVPDASPAPSVTAAREAAAALRDPFRAPPVSKVEAAKSEFERYALDQLKVSGIVSGPGAPRAIILMPSGNTGIVKLKQNLGNRNGRIEKITDKSVVVTEKVVNVLGEEEPLTTELALPEGVTTKAGAKASEGPIGTIGAPQVPAMTPAQFQVPGKPTSSEVNASTARTSAAAATTAGRESPTTVKLPEGVKALQNIERPTTPGGTMGGSAVVPTGGAPVSKQ